MGSFPQWRYWPYNPIVSSKISQLLEPQNRIILNSLALHLHLYKPRTDLGVVTETVAAVGVAPGKLSPKLLSK